MNDYIPEDVVMDIFSILPAKSLIRFKCLSKPWLAKISDPQFARWHSQKSRTQHHSGDQLLLLSSTDKKAFQISFDDDDYAVAAITVSNLTNNLLKKICPFMVLGCCDGLLCIHSKRRGMIELWNPNTRQIRKLPDLCSDPYLGGFYYDSCIDDYKVVIFFKKNFAVFELKGKSWRIVRNFTELHYKPYYCYKNYDFYHQTNIIEPINGAIHWMNYRGPQIFSFDLAKEKLAQVPLPPNHDHDSNYNYEIRMQLGEFQGSLCLMRSIHKRKACDHYTPNKVFVDQLGDASPFDGDAEVEVWVLREPVVSASWIKLACFSGKEWNRRGTMFVLDNGKVLMLVDGSSRMWKLYMCRLDHSEEQIVVDLESRVPCCMITTAIRYWGSLVSPNMHEG